MRTPRLRICVKKSAAEAQETIFDDMTNAAENQMLG